MRINEIELHTPDQLEFGELAFRKARRMIMTGNNPFPQWFELLGVAHSGPCLAWPTAGKEISAYHTVNFTVTDNLRIDLSGWSTNTLHVNPYIWLYARQSIKRDKEDKEVSHEYKNDKQAFQEFIANTLRKSYPMFNDIRYDSIDIRNISSPLNDRLSIMAQSDKVSKLLEPAVAEHGKLITTLYTGKKLVEFAKLIKASHAS